MYRTMKIMVRSSDDLYPYLDEIAHLTNNLYNAAMFRIRQVFTGIEKLSAQQPITSNEQEVLQEIQDTLPLMGAAYQMPSKGKTFLSYRFLDCLLKRSKNPDYTAERLPRQCAQQTLKQATKDMKSFFKLLQLYKKDPGALTGRPRIPGYKNKGGGCAFNMTNQETQILYLEDQCYLKFAKTDLRLTLGNEIPKNWRLKQVSVCPYHDVYFVNVTMDDATCAKEQKKESKRVCSIDLGVNNFAAITSAPVRC